MQAVKGAPSREHWKEAIPEPPGSVAEKANWACDDPLMGVGPLLICVVGAVESSTYSTGPEQADETSIADVAVAHREVLESSATVTPTPALSSAALEVTTGVPEQSKLV